jgi:hypothetical protein
MNDQPARTSFSSQKLSLAAFLLEDYELTKTGDSGQNFGLSGNY